MTACDTAMLLPSVAKHAIKVHTSAAGLLCAEKKEKMVMIITGDAWQQNTIALDEDEINRETEQRTRRELFAAVALLDLQKNSWEAAHRYQ